MLPVFNETDCILDVLKELTTVLEGEKFEKYEVIPVDDGSTDGTFEKILQYSKLNQNVKPLQLTRNFGQSAAMACGFDHAQYDLIIAMDSDGQNNPRDIPKLINKMSEGFDCVSGWRRNRTDKNINPAPPSKCIGRIANCACALATKISRTTL